MEKQNKEMESKINDRKKEHKTLFKDSLNLMSERIKDQCPKSSVSEINKIHQKIIIEKDQIESLNE